MFRRSTLVLTSLAAALLFPALASGADDHAHAPLSKEAIQGIPEGVATSITAIVVFLLVFAVLALKVWPVITKGLDERAAKIKHEIEAAELARKQAKEALDQYNRSLGEARAEAQKLIEHTKAQQAGLAAELKAKADIELGQMRERAMRDIEAAKRAAVAEIYAHGTTFATSVASKILRRAVTPDDTQRLVDESILQLQASKN